MFKGLKRYMFAGITAGMVALFAATGPADGAVSPTRTGTFADAARLWYSTPVGKRGHVRDDFTTRRSICKFADRHGGVRAQAVELVTDMTYDNYRNARQVNAWVATIAQGDCLRLGYADGVSGLVPVNLHHLPKGECWYEVSYYGKPRRVFIEPLCKG